MLRSTLVLAGNSNPPASVLPSCNVKSQQGIFNLCPLKEEADVKMCTPGNVSDVTFCYTLAFFRHAKTGCQGIKTPAVEVLKTGLGSGCRVLGSVATATSSIMQVGHDHGVQLSYLSGDICKQTKYRADIHIVCDRAAIIAKLASVQGSGSCRYTFIVHSTHGCPVARSVPDASEASHRAERVLLGVLMLGAVYFGIGIYYKRSLGYHQFPDYVPHVGCWLNCPSLVYDGVVFVKQSLFKAAGRRSSDPDFKQVSWAGRTAFHRDRSNPDRNTFEFFVPGSQ